MKSGIPWSVKGIEPEVREAAKDAARRSGLTLGEWLNSLILEQAVTAAPVKSGSIHPKVKDRFDSIAEELAMMTAERPQTAAGGYFEDSRPFLENNIDFDAVLERIENNERYLNEALGSVNERLKVINAQLAQQGETAPASTHDSAGYTALETAVRNIVSHLEISERRGQDALNAIQDQISSFGREDSAAANSMARIQQIEELIAELADRLEGQDKDSGKERFADLELEVASLAERLGSLQGSTEMLVEGAKSTALTSARAELRELEQHLQSLASHAQSSLKQSTASQAEIGHLKADIGDINKRIDDIRSETSFEREMDSLRSGVEQLSSRIAELPVDDLERRLDDITRRVTEIEIRGRALPQISDVEQRVYELEARLAESKPSLDAQGGLDDLQEQFNRMADRVAGTEDQLSAIAGIERSISQLFQALEDTREDAQEIAEQAASRAAEQFLQHAPASASGPSPELVTLEEALAAVKQHSAQSDRQTQETLDAVHDTLEVIISKLAELDAERLIPEENHDENQSSSPPTPTLPSATPSAEEPAAAEVQEWHSAVQYHLASTRRDLAESEPTPTAETLKGDHEPAKDFFVEPEPIVEFVNPEGASKIHTSTEDDDFIAAARRAAQAAAQGSRLGIGRFPHSGMQPDPARPKVRTTLPKFSFSLFRRAPALKPRHSRGLPGDIAAAADAATLPQENGRRRLLLAALLLLAAVSAYALRSGQKETELPIRVPQSEKESSAPAIAPAKGATMNPFVLAQPQDLSTAEPLPLSPAIGPETLRLAATSGGPQAQFVIAGRYLDGALVAQNSSEAAKWYWKAARQGLAPAQYQLATLFERGTGVLQSSEEARTWYEKAAAQGNVKAMHNLGVLLASGESPDYARAAHWFAVAAEYGLKDSQYNMAIFYERGLGVSEEPVEAFFWYSAAANQGDQDAVAKAKAIEDALPLELKNAARQQLLQWRPKEAEKDANVVLLALGHG